MFCSTEAAYLDFTYHNILLWTKFTELKLWKDAIKMRFQEAKTKEKSKIFAICPSSCGASKNWVLVFSILYLNEVQNYNHKLVLCPPRKK